MMVYIEYYACQLSLALIKHWFDFTGMVASLTPLPVIGVPVRASALDGMDSLLSIVQVHFFITDNITFSGCQLSKIAVTSSLAFQVSLLAYFLQWAHGKVDIPFSILYMLFLFNRFSFERKL